jgi:predicted RNase H-like HicB family nuclease
MEKEEAVAILQNALTGYVEDSAGEGSDEANNIQEAWDLVQGLIK